MRFKMNGSPARMGTISGTAGHSSALKMRAEQNAASALKQDPYADAKKKDPKLDEYIGVQGKTTPGSEEYEANQAKINLAYGKVRSKKLKAAQIKNVEAKKTTEKKKKGKLSSFVGKVFKKASPDKIAQRKTDKAEAKKQGVSVWQLKKNRKK